MRDDSHEAQEASRTERPLVSAAVTTYQRPEKARRAIESVMSQSYEPLEVIIVEDGSNSGVAGWLERSGHVDSVRYLRHENNRGLAAARNTALEIAEGEYIAYLDDDDRWKPNRIARQVDHLLTLSADQREQIGVVYCGLERHRGDTISSILHPENDGSLRSAIVEEGASTVQSSFLFDTSALRAVGGFDESLPSSIDHDIWMSLASADYHVLALDEPLVISGEDPHERMTTNTEERLEGVRAFLEKWQPEYARWTSDESAERWAEEYFVRVIGRLAAQHLIAGDWSSGRRAVNAIFAYSDLILFNIAVLLRLLAETATKRYLPAPIVRRIAELRMKVANRS